MVFSLYSTRRAAVKAPEVKVECMHDAAKLAHRRMKGYDAEFDRVLARLPRWSLRIDLPSRADRFYIPAFRMLRHLRQVFDVTCQGRSAWLVAHENAKIVIELGDDDDDGNDGYCSVVVRGAIAARSRRSARARKPW